MQITASTISLTVDDVAASSEFLINYFGFSLRGADEEGNFAALGRDDVGLNIVFLRRGCEVLPESYRDNRAEGVILAFTVKELETEELRLRNANVNITLPLQEESWGERLFQVTDPNGVIIQLVEWSDDNPAY